jgi:hypothetical protein
MSARFPALTSCRATVGFRGVRGDTALSYDSGHLYVAEAGRGDEKCLGEGPDGGFALHGELRGVETFAPPEAGEPTTPPWNKLVKITHGKARPFAVFPDHDKNQGVRLRLVDRGP